MQPETCKLTSKCSGLECSLNQGAADPYIESVGSGSVLEKMYSSGFNIQIQDPTKILLFILKILDHINNISIILTLKGS